VILKKYLPVDEEVDDHNARDIQFGKMESALQLLGEPCKTIMEDFYIHNRSMQDICERLVIPMPIMPKHKNINACKG